MSHRGAVPAARLAAITLTAWIAIGCGGGANRAQPRAAADRRPAFAPEMRQQLLTSAVAVLRELDRYEPQRGREQVFDRLVQWHAAAKADARRERSPPGMAAPDLFDALPERLRQAAADAIERESFDAMDDIQFIRDRCWLESIARTSGGGAGDELVLAERLFGWTVRSLAAVGDPPMVPGDKEPGSRWFFPGEILLSGRASGPQRAWIFLELLRQAGLDGVMLALPGAEGEASRAWLPAVVIGGEAYLFEPTYGMAIPGPGGKGVATARQAAADPSVLESLSLPDRRYPVQASDLARGLDVLVAADPRNLAPRMAALDRDLAAAHGIRLVVAAKDLSARAAAAIPGDRVAVVGLWTFPWETFARRPLAARPLVEDLGPLEVPAGEPPFPALLAGRVREFRGAYAEAKQAYLSARLAQRRVSQGVTGLPGPQAAVVSRLAERMKEDATYWLGMLMVAEGENEAAADYLGRMTLEAVPDSRWTDAARIGLAGALVGLGRDAEAAALLREDGSPQRFGSRLRAARIEAAVEPGPP